MGGPGQASAGGAQHLGHTLARESRASLQARNVHQTPSRPSPENRKVAFRHPHQMFPVEAPELESSEPGPRQEERIRLHTPAPPGWADNKEKDGVLEAKLPTKDSKLL